ncbi:MAG: hypothetical protein SGPRY_002194, partial [Prymnesium sp.]
TCPWAQPTPRVRSAGYNEAMPARKIAKKKDNSETQASAIKEAFFTPLRFATSREEKAIVHVQYQKARYEVMQQKGLLRRSLRSELA